MGSKAQLRISASIIFAATILCLSGVWLLPGEPSQSEASMVEHGNVAFEVSPDGKSIVFSGARGDLWLFSLESEKVSRLTSSDARDSTPSFSPDGKSIVYASTLKNAKGSSIFTRTIDGGEVIRLTQDEEFSDSQPCFSLDGKKIAFVRAHRHRPYSLGGWTWDKCDIYVVDADGKNLKRLTTREHYDIAGVSFVGDSKKIVYSSDENPADDDSKQTLFEVSPDGTISTVKPKTDGDYYAWISDPRSSDDGVHIVHISDRANPYHYDVLITNLQTGESKSVGAIKVSRYNQNPVMTADGARIIFLAETEWNAASRPVFSLWQVNADGTDAKQLADSSLFTSPEKWNESR